MDKEEIINKITEMENEIKNLKEELNKQEEPKKGRWKPELREMYHFIDDEGSIIYTHWDDCAIDRGRYAIDNVFKTEEEAKFAVEQFKVLAELKEYADDDKEWNNSNSHWVIEYCTNEGNVKAAYYLYSRNIPFNLYFSSQKQAQKAIDAIGEERLKKYYFCVEE